jgi:hypothetical protein
VQIDDGNREVLDGGDHVAHGGDYRTLASI